MPTQCSSAAAAITTSASRSASRGRHHRRLTPRAEQQPGQAQRDVQHDLDVDPGVVGHVQPVGVERPASPPGLDLRVGVDGREQLLERRLPRVGALMWTRLDRLARTRVIARRRLLASAARAAWPIISSRCTLRGSAARRLVRAPRSPSERSSQAFVSSAKQRSSASSRSARSAGSSTGVSSSTRVSRLRGMRSAEPMQTRRLVAALERVDARVLEEAPDDRDDADVLRHALDARAAGSRCRGR